MKIGQSRVLSLLSVTLIYIVAAVSGIAVYRALHYDFWLSLLIADVAATVIVFMFSVIFGNASVYDPYWSVQPPVILAAFALKAEMTPFRVLLLVAVCFWALRLTANWIYTFHSFEYQDWRYIMLKEKTGIFYPVINFVGIHMVPTLIVYACTLPAVYVLRFEAEPGVPGFLFILLSFGAVFLQGTADIQMHRFRKKKTGGFIRTGLWKHSRHPNYLAEILMWWGVALAAVCAMPERWYLCLGAFLNTLLFLFVSIPMADRRQSKKPGFDEYRSRTHMLLPVKKLRITKSNSVGVEKENWRLVKGQQEYLSDKTLYFRTWKASHKEWDHDHCEFCGEKFSELLDTLHEGYTTQDSNVWICTGCFDEFKETFRWKTADRAEHRH